ncbi:MAG TPA: hypothetical protein VH163_04235, partial [Gemmatimonadales bacterium]|nr:hypothetical protein [Gemmatimonadales bacterium]
IGVSMNLDFDHAHPFAWDDGTLTPVNPALRASQWAQAVNEGGAVTGYEAYNGHDNHGFVVDNGTSWDLGAIDGTPGSLQAGVSQGNAINRHGDVAGNSGFNPVLWVRK